MNNFDHLPERQEKSKNSLVIGNAVIINPCNCVTCGQHYAVTFEGSVVIIDGQLINRQIPHNFHCPNCNSTYIRWGKEAEITQ